MGKELMNETAKELTDLELMIMTIIWDKGDATARDVYEALQDIHPIAYTSTLNTMTRMMDDDILSARRIGKAYLFSPKLKRTDAIRQGIQRLAKRFFNGSVNSMMSHLLDDEQISDGERRYLEQLIERTTSTKSKS